MIKEAIGTGASIEEAIEAAKSALGAPENADVSTEILELPKKKTLGLFGGSPAKARAYYEAAEEKKVPQKTTKAQKPAAKAQPAKKEVKKPAVPAKKPASAAPKAEPIASFESGETAKAYISMMLKGMGIEDVKIDMTEDEDGININLDCESGYGHIIGRRGETLDAIQYLTRLVINKGKENYKRVSINAGNYRQKREDTLGELAKRQAERVKKYGRNICLDPMNPYERRIIHTTIQEIEGVNSHSVGSEAERKVVITLAEGFKPSYSGRSGGGRSGDYRRKSSNHGGYNKNNSSSAPKEQRAPRSDSGGSLYGKIEPKKPQE